MGLGLGGYAGLAGIGKVMGEENRRREEREYQEKLAKEQEARSQWDSAVNMLEAIATSPNADPAAQEEAMKHYMYFQTQGRQNTKPKELQTALQNIQNAAAMRRQQEVLGLRAPIETSHEASGTVQSAAPGLSKMAEDYSQVFPGSAGTMLNAMSRLMSEKGQQAHQLNQRTGQTLADPALDPNQQFSRSPFRTREEMIREQQMLADEQLRRQIEMRLALQGPDNKVVSKGGHLVGPDGEVLFAAPESQSTGNTAFDRYVQAQLDNWSARNGGIEPPPGVRADIMINARRAWNPSSTVDGDGDDKPVGSWKDWVVEGRVVGQYNPARNEFRNFANGELVEGIPKQFQTTGNTKLTANQLKAVQKLGEMTYWLADVADILQRRPELAGGAFGWKGRLTDFKGKYLPTDDPDVIRLSNRLRLIAERAAREATGAQAGLAELHELYKLVGDMTAANIHELVGLRLAENIRLFNSYMGREWRPQDYSYAGDFTVDDVISNFRAAQDQARESVNNVLPSRQSVSEPVSDTDLSGDNEEEEQDPWDAMMEEFVQAGSG